MQLREHGGERSARDKKRGATSSREVSVRGRVENVLYILDGAGK